MKKALFIILVMAIVFTMAIPVSLGAPEDEASATPTTTDTEGTEDPMPDDAAPDTSLSTFEVLKLESSGTRVFKIQMRLRDLGYLNYRPTGQYFGLTQDAVMKFQQNNGLDTDGQIGQITYDKMFASDAVRKPLSAAVTVYYGVGESNGTTAPGELADWATVVDAAFPVGTTATVTDFNTGKAFTVQRTGGTGHADVEVTDAAAYATFLECYGVPADVEPTWEKRAVVVTVGTASYAASLFGHPAGADTLPDNAMSGHTCLYFMGSTSDVLGFVDKEHYKMVLIAGGKSEGELQYQQ